MSYKSDVLTISSTNAEQPFTEEAIGFVPGNVYISVETQNLRVWYDGRTPTATEGHPLYAGASYTFYSPDVMNLKMIAETGTSTVTYTAKGR